MPLPRGTVVWAQLGPVQGHEQDGDRPCVVLNDPDLEPDQRFPVLIIVPMSRTPHDGPLYPLLRSPFMGLGRETWSTVLCDQIRVIDPRRVRTRAGRLTPADQKLVDDALRLILKLPATPPAALAPAPALTSFALDL